MPRIDGLPSVFAWCSHGDRECRNCRIAYRKAPGVWVLCECPNHTTTTKENAS